MKRYLNYKAAPKVESTRISQCNKMFEVVWCIAYRKVNYTNSHQFIHDEEHQTS